MSNIFLLFCFQATGGRSVRLPWTRGFAKFSMTGDCRLIPPFTPLAYINFNNSCNFFLLGLAAVNNFGVGGVNVHILVEPNYKTETKDNLKIAEEIPRIVNICGRTEEAVRHVMDFIENNPNKVTREFLALLADTMKYKPTVNSAGLPFKGDINLI